ncbi:hypothetical protein CON64_19870 [Bacillus pseudomycoides]|nr:hypothetical protein CON64_19870 [Bacillus pseudomycoides]
MSRKAEGDGAPDVEVLFTSQEGAKPPTILAAGAGHLEKRIRLPHDEFCRRVFISGRTADIS